MFAQHKPHYHQTGKRSAHTRKPALLIIESSTPAICLRTMHWTLTRFLGGFLSLRDPRKAFSVRLIRLIRARTGLETTAVNIFVLSKSLMQWILLSPRRREDNGLSVTRGTRTDAVSGIRVVDLAKSCQ